MNKLIFLGTLSLAVVAANAAAEAKTETGPALIAKVCKKAANKDLCTSSLKEDPGTKNADLAKLALISIRLITYTAIDNLNFIFKKSDPKHPGEPVQLCYSDCTDNYSGAVEQLDDSFTDLITKKYDDVKKKIDSALLFEDACQVGFTASLKNNPMNDQNIKFRNLGKNAISLVEALKEANH